MQQQGSYQQFKKAPKNRMGFLPWAILGVAVLIMFGALIISSLHREPPPKPRGEYRQSRVHLTIQSNVTGAEIYVNGQQKAVIGMNKKGKLFNLAPKKYQVVLKKEGYVDRTETVEITGTKLSQTVQIDMQPAGIVNE